VDLVRFVKVSPFSEVTSAPTQVVLINGCAENTNIIMQADFLLELQPGILL